MSRVTSNVARGVSVTQLLGVGHIATQYAGSIFFSDSVVFALNRMLGITGIPH